MIVRRREAEGLIYTGKRQDTRRWSILPHHTTTSILISYGVVGCVVILLIIPIYSTKVPRYLII